MGSFSLIHWAVLILVMILLFGRGRISDLMGDLAKGITSFKKGLADEDNGAAPTTKAPPAQLTESKSGGSASSSASGAASGSASGSGSGSQGSDDTRR